MNISEMTDTHRWLNHERILDPAIKKRYRKWISLIIDPVLDIGMDEENWDRWINDRGFVPFTPDEQKVISRVYRMLMMPLEYNDSKCFTRAQKWSTKDSVLYALRLSAIGEDVVPQYNRDELLKFKTWYSMPEAYLVQQLITVGDHEGRILMADKTTPTNDWALPLEIPSPAFRRECAELFKEMHQDLRDPWRGRDGWYWSKERLWSIATGNSFILRGDTLPAYMPLSVY